jgi:hypothetical protein
MFNSVITNFIFWWKIIASTGWTLYKVTVRGKGTLDNTFLFCP